MSPFVDLKRKDETQLPTMMQRQKHLSREIQNIARQQIKLTKHSIELWFKTKILDLHQVQGRNGPKTVSVSLRSNSKLVIIAVIFACVDSFHRLSV